MTPRPLTLLDFLASIGRGTYAASGYVWADGYVVHVSELLPILRMLK